LLFNRLQSRRKQQRTLCSDQSTHHRCRLCSDSQELKRRQLAHGARNRAGQLVVAQAPAKSTKSTANSLFRPSSPLFQLTDAQATTAGPRCSESCRSADCRPSTCKIDETTATLCSDQHKPTPRRRPCFNSQAHKGRQLAHGARNRAGQLSGVQGPAKSTKHQPQHKHTSILTQQSRCSQNTSDDCQSTLQSPQSAGTMQGNNLKKESYFFAPFAFLLCDVCHTKSIVESHERSVLRQRELWRDESEASGDEKKRKSDHLSKN
jgi:hypothetical protein